ncbi:MAG: TolC family protein [Deltaproteobacteria bacterium]|nr:TolC family protein [Deltaproteobacteria bacterium]
MRLTLWCALFVSALLLLPAPGWGQESLSITLGEALTLARDRNPDLLATRQELEVARGRLVKARYPSQFNPEIGSEAAYRERNEPGETGSVTDFSITLSQQVEIAGQRGQRIREAEQSLARTEAGVHDRERLLDAEVKATFFQALARRRRLELLRTIEELNRRVRDATAARVQAGESPVMEENLAQIRYGQSRKETLTAEADEAAALLELRRLLNLSAEALIEPVGELRGEGKEVALRETLERALTTRPDLAAAGREVERVDAELALTRRLAVPNPTIEGFYRKEERGPDRIAGIGLRIPLPLFDRKQGELVALAGRQSQARFEVDARRRTIEQEVSEALRRYDATRRTLMVFEQDVLARVDENFRFIETAYRAGKIDLFQFIVVQNDLVAAQLSYIDSLARFREAEVNLERAVGGPF